MAFEIIDRELEPDPRQMLITDGVGFWVIVESRAHGFLSAVVPADEHGNVTDWTPVAEYRGVPKAQAYEQFKADNA